MTVAERMAARLASTPRAEQGAPCAACGDTALACQLRFVTIDDWCCRWCRRHGAGLVHR